MEAETFLREFESSLVREIFERGTAVGAGNVSFSVKARRFTGAGYYADVENAALRIDDGPRVLGSSVTVHFNDGSVRYGANLFFDAGRLTCIEIFNFGEGWPERLLAGASAELQDRVTSKTDTAGSA